MADDCPVCGKALDPNQIKKSELRKRYGLVTFFSTLAPLVFVVIIDLTDIMPAHPWTNFPIYSTIGLGVALAALLRGIFAYRSRIKREGLQNVFIDSF